MNEKIEFEPVKVKGNERADINLSEISEEDVLKDETGVLVVSKASKWCLKNNDHFKEEGNKSFPHEGLVCMVCKEEVVMSNRFFNLLSKNPRLEVVCIQCLPILVKVKNEQR